MPGMYFREFSLQHFDCFDYFFVVFMSKSGGQIACFCLCFCVFSELIVPVVVVVVVVVVDIVIVVVFQR